MEVWTLALLVSLVACLAPSQYRAAHLAVPNTRAIHTDNFLKPRDDSADVASKIYTAPIIHSTDTEVFGDVAANANANANAKRDVDVVSLLKRTDIAYYAQLSIGSPAQKVYVQLDTGSFELWVDPACSNLVSPSDNQFCLFTGIYNASVSTTSLVLGSTKDLKYGIGSASVSYVTDDINLGNSVTLNHVQFGVASGGTQQEFSGILGIGHGQNVTISYKNFIDELQSQGVTNTKAFSLALGSKNETKGVIVFGGIDKGKYAGNLQTLPILPASSRATDGVPRYWITLQSMSLMPPSGMLKTYANTSMPVFLDSGATLTLLPARIANAVAKDFGAAAADGNGFYQVDCALRSLNGTLNFAFNGIQIQVPYNEMIRQLQLSDGMQCYLGISASDQFTLLGDSFLRSAYVVFDQTNNAIHMAQYANCTTSQVEITASTNFTNIKGLCDFAVPGSSGMSANKLPGNATVPASAGAHTDLPKGGSAGAVSSVSTGWIVGLVMASRLGLEVLHNARC